MRRATEYWVGGYGTANNFYPRSPCGERHIVPVRVGISTPISIHALLAESDGCISARNPEGFHFYPRSPCGERPPVRDVIQWEGIFLSTLSLRRATYLVRGQRPNWGISIHALLAESDTSSSYSSYLEESISIHALLAESDNRYGRPIDVQLVFLSTLSLRRATLNQIAPRRFHYHFYPRSPCGERLCRISFSALGMYFYPRSPCGERPAIDVFLAVWAVISIHALLAESDYITLRNPFKYSKFLSTLSLRRATGPFRRSILMILFLSTLSLRRATADALTDDVSTGGFLSTLSLRRATTADMTD